MLGAREVGFRAQDTCQLTDRQDWWVWTDHGGPVTPDCIPAAVIRRIQSEFWTGGNIGRKHLSSFRYPLASSNIRANCPCLLCSRSLKSFEKSSKGPF